MIDLTYMECPTAIALYYKEQINNITYAKIEVDDIKIIDTQDVPGTNGSVVQVKTKITLKDKSYFEKVYDTANLDGKWKVFIEVV